jgi:hypothetical protein
MKSPTDCQSDYMAQRMAFDIFGSAGRLAAAPKFDKAVPHKYFIERYAGGPFSNEEDRK